ncbi:MAG: hypothetical protein BVN33_17115 [Proteobacteria bacterium ST_bin13]|nr:MAG: hypothetical protein BVN33_17115 [Proteobacteria bacterium ST_bin13]
MAAFLRDGRGSAARELALAPVAGRDVQPLFEGRSDIVRRSLPLGIIMHVAMSRSAWRAARAAHQASWTWRSCTVMVGMLLSEGTADWACAEGATKVAAANMAAKIVLVIDVILG